MKALVIDDSGATRKILASMLEDLGFAVAQACHGKDALETIQRDGPPTLVILDRNMPEMDGMEFLARVRALDGCSGLKIVMCSTVNAAERITEALDAGADEYMLKPFTKECVLDKLGMLGFYPEEIGEAAS